MSEFLEYPYRDKFGFNIDEIYDMPIYRWKLLQDKMHTYIKHKKAEEEIKRRNEENKGR